MNENQEREAVSLAQLAETMKLAIDSVGTVGDELADLVKTQTKLVAALTTQGKGLEDARRERYAFASAAKIQTQRGDRWRFVALVQLAIAIAAVAVELLR